MKGRIRHIISFAFAAGFIVCLTQAFFYNSIPEERQEISILQLEDSYEERTARTYLTSGQDMGLPFAFWGEQQEADIHNKDLNRNTKAMVIAVCGDSSLVLESSSILESGVDKNCLIDKQTALELFGSTSVTGQRVKIDQAEYRVAGILTRAERTVLIQADEENKALLDKISLRIPKRENRNESIRLFQNQIGIEGKEIPIHYYRIFGNFMVYLLPVLLFGSVLFELMKMMHAHKNMPVYWLSLLLLFLGMLVVYVWILDIHGQFPLELLPSKWSDFDFWANLWKEKMKEAALLVQVEKSRPQLILFHQLLKVIGYCAAAVLFVMVSLPELKKIKKQQVFFVMLPCLFVSFLTVAGTSQGNVPAAENRVIWLCLPAYLAGRCLIKELKEKVGTVH